MQKSTRWWLFFVIILSLGLLTTIYLGVSGFFCSVSSKRSNIDMVAGETKNIGVVANQTSTLALVVDGNLLPGQDFEQKIQILSNENGKNVLLRVRVVCDNNEKIGVNITDNFKLEEDGYYYSKSALSGAEKVIFADKIKILSDAKIVSGKKYILNIIVECLDEQAPISEIW